MLRPNLALWVVVASFAAWLASCSSDVDGYFIATSESSNTLKDGGGGSVGANQSGGAAGHVLTSGGNGQGAGSGGTEPDSGAGGQTLTNTGGAGGANTGGTDASVTSGGSGNGGTGGATGGMPNTGGTGTGGTGTGGTNTGGTGTGGTGTGGINTGGTGTGGRGTGGTNTGGTGTGGTNTGGTGTGGTNTGGTNTGGTSTGGVGTGGATGGTGGATGGTGGSPGDPTQQTLSGGSVSGITAAAWEPTSNRFYLLQPAARQYWILATSGAVTGPFALQGSGTVGSTAFGASATDVYFVSGSPTTLYRQSITTGSAFSKAVPGNPLAVTLSGAFAGTWFFLGNSGGASQAIREDLMVFDGTAPTLTNVTVATTDGASFAFRSNVSNQSAVHRIAPGSFAFNGTPCLTGAFNTNKDMPLSVYGSSVAWVMLFPTDAYPYKLNIADISSSGTCGTPATTSYANSTNASQVVGLISTTDALVTSLVTATGGSATVEIKRPTDGAFSRAPLSVNLSSSGYPAAFVVAASAPAQTHYAVLVTKNTPALIKF